MLQLDTRLDPDRIHILRYRADAIRTRLLATSAQAAELLERHGRLAAELEEETVLEARQGGFGLPPVSTTEQSPTAASDASDQTKRAELARLAKALAELRAEQAELSRRWRDAVGLADRCQKILRPPAPPFARAAAA